MWKACGCFWKDWYRRGRDQGRYKLSFISSFRLNFESSKLRVGSVWNILLRVASSTTRQFFDVNRKNCLNRYLRRVLQRGNADEYNVYRPGFIGPRKSFLHRNGRSAGIWKRKTWIVTERSWDVSASRVSSWLEKWDISLTHPDWFIYAVKDTLLSGVQGSFDKLRGSLSFEFFYHFSSVSRYWFRVIAFKDRGGT